MLWLVRCGLIDLDGIGFFSVFKVGVVILGWGEGIRLGFG